MRLRPSPGKRLRRLCQVTGLTMVLTWLSFFILGNSITKPITTPISPAPALAGPPVFSDSGRLEPGSLLSSNPVAGAFVYAIPGSDGSEVFVSVDRAAPTGSSIFLNVDPGTGPANHEDSYAMALSGTTYVATAIGFAPEMDIGDDGDDAMSITTTVGSQVMSTGDINFQRAYISATVEGETLMVDGGDFELRMPHTHTLSFSKAYVLAMSTNVPPGPLSIGYRFASNTYNLRPSHSLTQSEKFMTLNLRFQEPLPGGADPRTLTIVGWDPLREAWDVLGGSLLDSNDFDEREDYLSLGVKRFRIYALATTPTWRDTFQEWSLTGISDLSNTQWGPGQTIILSSAATYGTVTSVPITPTGAAGWGTLHFSATTPLSAGLTVDVLDLNDDVLLANVSDGAELSASLPLDSCPSLKLRATLTRTETADSTPKLHEWRVGWVPKVHSIYLPLVIKGGW